MIYNPIKIEEKWRERWGKEKEWKVDIRGAKKPYYNLMMFPYPSAEGLHMGNVYAFTGSDIHGRYMRMRGLDVFEPMGFDAFGIHSENFAIKKGVHPKTQTASNLNHFREQFKRMGAIFDWDHEVNTSSPNYYKWTQWLFVQLYKNGLAYRAKAPVDWCPSCKTVLADEQVISGKCERCGTEVLQKELEQWFFKITAYAERLLNNLDTLDWPAAIKTTQRNWIGRSYGTEISFKIFVPQPPASSLQPPAIKIFTTRPDTLFGATYMVVAPEQAIVGELKESIKNWDEVQKYIDASRKKTELERTDLAKEKTGVELKGVHAINPANNQEIPVWIADYVLSNYGTGAIMAVPAHDERDFEFAKKYDLPIKMVICPNYPEPNCPILENAYEGEGWLVDSGEFNGVPSEEAKGKVAEFVGGEKKVNYHLRDWLISRQRYWGPPIPIIYCRACATINDRDNNQQPTTNHQREGRDFVVIDGEKYAIILVPEEELPVELPYVEEFRPTGTEKSPLATIEDFVKVRCPQCGGEARRETDISDNFLDSAWYFLRYPSTDFDDKPFDDVLTKKWLPVDMYIGGKEHSVLHLMYARFITMALHDMGLVDFEEPFTKFRAHGLLIREGAKMSKSKGNVVSPDEYFDSYGADVVRMYLMFLGPYEQGGDWQDKGIAGLARFLKRVWRLVDNSAHGAKSKNAQAQTVNDQELERVTHKTIKKVTEDIESLHYNTAIAALMEFVNEVTKQRLQVTLRQAQVFDSETQTRGGPERFIPSGVEGSRGTSYKLQITTLLKLLAPFAPHITEELWRETLGQKTSIHNESWPEFDAQKIQEEKARMVVQVNGKARSQIEVDTDATEDVIKDVASKDEKIQKWIAGKQVQRVIIVPRRVVNIVV